MSKRKTKPRRRGKHDDAAHRHSADTGAADATTVAWTVAVTMALLCDIVAIAAYYYTQSDPTARNVNLLKELMLVAGAIIGFVALAMLPIVVRVRRIPPPRGIVAFAICASAAPILALILRNLR